MQLIKKLGRRKNKTGNNYTSWGLFKCGVIVCGKEVERPLGNGKRNKSCGCNQYSEEMRQKVRESHLGMKATEETKEKMREATKGENNPFYGKKHTEEARQKIKDNHADFSGENHPMYGKKQTEEARQKMSESHKGVEPWNKGKDNPYSEKTVQKMSESRKGKTGELSPNWQNGISFEKYGIEFNKELKQQILERDNYTCQCPDCEYKTDALDLHHIDYNKKNNNPENIITLCDNCHAKTFGKKKRQYWTEFYQSIIKIGVNYGN